MRNVAPDPARRARDEHNAIVKISARIVVLLCQAGSGMSASVRLDAPCYPRVRNDRHLRNLNAFHAALLRKLLRRGDRRMDRSRGADAKVAAAA